MRFADRLLAPRPHLAPTQVLAKGVRAVSLGAFVNELNL